MGHRRHSNQLGSDDDHELVSFRHADLRRTTRRLGLRRFGNFLDLRACTYAAEIEIGIRTSPGAAQYLLRSFICIRSETIPRFLNMDMVARAWKVVIVLTSSTMKAFAASM